MVIYKVAAYDNWSLGESCLQEVLLTAKHQCTMISLCVNKVLSRKKIDATASQAHSGVILQL